MKKELLSSLVLSISLIVIAYLDRGYFAIGGEWFAWIIPLVIKMEKENPVCVNAN